MGRKRIEIKSGDRYGRLTIIKEVRHHIKPCGCKRRKFLVQCDCGSDPFEVSLDNLRSGNTCSCGCVRKEIAKGKVKKINKKNHNKKSNLFLIHVPSNTVIGYTTKMEKFYFDREDLEKVKQYCWSINNNNGYLQGRNTNTGKMIRLHRLIINCPKDKVIDHANRNKLDCRKVNLRICTVAENNKNKSIGKRNKSGVVGVSWHKRENKWRAYINVDNKHIHLGYFTDKEEAIKARLQAEKEYFGDYAPTNYTL